MPHARHPKPLITTEGELIATRAPYRAGVVTVAIGTAASLLLLWGVPDNWKKNIAQASSLPATSQ